MEIDKNNPAVRALMRKFAVFLSDAAELGLINRHHLPADHILIPMLVITPGPEDNFDCNMDIMVRDGANPERFYSDLRKYAEEVRQQTS